MSGFDVIVFDWDGTLVDSESHIVSCLTHAAEQMGLPARSYDENKSIIGLGMREALLSLYPDLTKTDMEQMRQYYSAEFFRSPTSAAQLFDGVRDALDELKRREIRLAVATGKSRHGLEKALDSTALRPFFDITRCADETRSKPHPMMLEEIIAHFAVHPDKMVMVGDTEFDLEMAASAGVPSIGVSHGVHELERLQKHKPVQVIDHFSELLSIIQGAS